MSGSFDDSMQEMMAMGVAAATAGQAQLERTRAIFTRFLDLRRQHGENNTVPPRAHAVIAVEEVQALCDVLAGKEQTQLAENIDSGVEPDVEPDMCGPGCDHTESP